MRMYSDMFIQWLEDTGHYYCWSSDRNSNSIFDSPSISAFYTHTVKYPDYHIDNMWMDYALGILPSVVYRNLVLSGSEHFSEEESDDYDKNNNTYVRFSLSANMFIPSAADSMCINGKHIFLDATTSETTHIAKVLNKAIRTKQELKLPKYLCNVFSVESLTKLKEGLKNEKNKQED